MTYIVGMILFSLLAAVAWYGFRDSFEVLGRFYGQEVSGRQFYGSSLIPRTSAKRAVARMPDATKGRAGTRFTSVQTASLKSRRRVSGYHAFLRNTAVA